MYFDALTTAAVRDELESSLLGGRVQDVVEVDEETIGMEVYAGRRFYLIANGGHAPRIHLVPDKLRRGVETPSRLLLMLRRHLRGARLQAITQPPWERVLHLEFDGHEGMVTLIAELIDRRANLILVRDGIVLECLRRVGPRENRVRVTLPGHPYRPPPPQLKRDPSELSPVILDGLLLADPDIPAWRALVRGLAGFSPLAARETVFRATGEPETPCRDTPTDSLLDAIEEMLRPIWEQCWEPSLAGPDKQPTAFAPYELTHMGDYRRVRTIGEALVAFYGAPVGRDAYRAAKEPILAMIAEAKRRIERRADSLRRSLVPEDELERLRRSGELILAYQYAIRPGQDVLEARYLPDEPPMRIRLDPKATPVENAQRYFERYTKAKRANETVPERLDAARRELEFLAQLETDLELAESWPDIDAVREMLENHGYWHGQKVTRPKSGRPKPIRVVTDDGFEILVGRNAWQNDEITFKRAGPDDLWLHARGVLGAHVIIRSGGRDVPEDVIMQAASLAAAYSAARGEVKVPVDVTRRRYVKKIRGGKPGMVTYRNERTIEVRPETDRT